MAIADGFVAGNTRSLVFPRNTPANRPGRHIFLRGIGALIPGIYSQVYTGTVVIGGSGDDELAGMALAAVSRIPNSTSNIPWIYLAGTTASTDFPGAENSKYNGGQTDGFVTYIAATGIFATPYKTLYVGGSGEDRITSLASNAKYLLGSALDGYPTFIAFAGVTDSPDLGAASAPRKSLAGAKSAFYGVTLHNFFPGPVSYGYLGGSRDDAAYAIAFESAGSLWIGGETRSADFPSSNPGLSGPSDAFLVNLKLPSDSSRIGELTKSAAYRIGGSGEDSIRALVGTTSVDASGVIGYLLPQPIAVDGIGFAGNSTSPDLPARNAAQPRFGGVQDGFVGIWDTTAGAPRWLTYVGGSGRDEVTSMTQNWAGDLYVGGWTVSPDLPVSNALQPRPGGGEDGMFAVYGYDGAIQQLSYFGGSGDDRIRDVRTIYDAGVRVVGSTSSADLTQQQPSQERGGRLDGFVADLGLDLLIGPSELLLAKDGMLTFAVRPSRTSFREHLTCRSSDPSRVRFVYLGRSMDEVTAAAEDNIMVEALADSGEVTLTISAQGYSTKTIRVKLYPGAFVPNRASYWDAFSTWNSVQYPYVLSADYRAIDPLTGNPIGLRNQLRPGAGAAALQWSVSNPEIFHLSISRGQMQLRALHGGQAVLKLTVPGFRVVQAKQVITAVAPELVLPTSEFHLGQDLQKNLPVLFSVNGIPIRDNYQGKLTVRSGDPSRLLLSGRESVTVTLNVTPLAIAAQALAGEGRVQVFFTSTEFEGERAMTVILEPAVLRVGFRQDSPSVSSAIASGGTILNGAIATLTYSLRGVNDPDPASSLRDGAPPLTLKLSNSNPQVVEVNRLSVTLPPGANFYQLTSLSIGSADLSISCICGNIRLADTTLHVESRRQGASAVKLPESIVVGKGLQTSFFFQYSSTDGLVEVTSSDPTALRVSSSSTAQGSRQIAIGMGSISPSDFAFYLQALKGDGEVQVKLRFPDGEERTIRALLKPSAIGFRDYGLPTRVGVAVWAVDPDTGVGLVTQTPQPGVTIPVRIRSEGAAVTLSQSTFVFSSTNAFPPDITFTLPEAGQVATLILDADGGFAPLGAMGRYRIAPTAGQLSLRNVVLAKDELGIYGYNIQSITTITSSDPQRVLVSAAPDSAAVPSIDDNYIGATQFFLHALSDSGSATIRIETAGSAAREFKVAFRPLQLNVAPLNLTAGQMAEVLISLNTSYSLRPGASTLRFNVQSTDTRVVKVQTPDVELNRDVNRSSGPLRVIGVAEGVAQLIFDGPPDVIVTPNPVTVSVADASQAILPSFTLGRNLQIGEQVNVSAVLSDLNGGTVTLTSSDPARLLLSTEATKAGTASVNAIVKSGEFVTQPVYMQGIGAGDVSIAAAYGGSAVQAARVTIAPSWIECPPPIFGVELGWQGDLICRASYDGRSNYYRPVMLLPALSDVTVQLSNFSPEILSATPTAVRLSPDNSVALFRVSTLALGTGRLQVSQPSGFGPVPDGSDTLSIAVGLARFPRPGASGRFTLGRDMQTSSVVLALADMTVTATSEQPSLVIVSADAKTPGSVTASASMSRRDEAFALQAVGSSGTAEVVFSAPGYESVRVPVVLRPTQISMAATSGSQFLQVAPGGTGTFKVGLNTLYGTALRPGARVQLALSASPPGIVTFDPAQVVLDSATPQVQVTVHGIVSGNAAVGASIPDGVVLSGPPMTVTVQ